jgi:putative cell wall-binding protein
MTRFRAPRLRHLTSAVLATALLFVGSVVATRPPAASAAPHPVATHLRQVPLRHMDAAALGQAMRTPVAATPEARTYYPQAKPAAGFATPALATNGRLHVIGVTWDEGALSTSDRVEYRVRDKGSWGAWTTMAAEDDHGPDPGTPEAQHERGGTDPYVVTSDAVQVRVLTAKPKAPDAQLDVIDPSVSAADAPTSQAGAAQAAGTQPTILTRAQWGADESLRTGVPEYGTIKAGFVHHTVNANTYSASQVPAIIRGIYAFHTQSRGWSDIGYNFLIDRFGRTWEGRAGGVDQPVIGAHTGGYNSQLFGAAAIGTFNTAQPSSAMMSAFNKLFAWKLGLAHVDPVGKVTLTGMTRAVYTVSGHRDADGAPNQTECPGNALYAKLGSIRTAAKQLMGAAFFEPRVTSTSWGYGNPGLVVTARPNRLPMKWTLQVQSACRAGVLAAATGDATSTTAGGITAGWNGKLSNGSWAPPGDYYLSVSASAGSGTINSVPPYTVRVHIASAPGAPQGYCPPRIGGSDRYETAVGVARAANPSSKVIVLASGTDAGMPDALVAAPLARAKSAALLLTGPDRLPASTYAEVRRRGATTAYLVGGTGVISSAIDTQLKNLGVTHLERYWGNNRYGTAASVAVHLGGARPDVLVASGRPDAMADGLVLSGAAAALGRPILLVAATSVPSETRWALGRLGTQRTVVAGGTGVVPDSVVRALPDPTRVAGSDRYATGTAVASWASRLIDAKDVVLSSGEPQSLVDTLSGGQFGRITLYAKSTSMPTTTAGWLDRAPGLSSVTVLGGTAAVSDLVAGRAQQAVLQ